MRAQSPTAKRGVSPNTPRRPFLVALRSGMLLQPLLSPSAYLGILGERYGWAPDPLTKVKHSVLDEVCEVVPEIDGELLDPVGYEEVFGVWRFGRTVLVVGADDVDPSLLGRQLAVHAAEEELAKGEESIRLPVRVPLAGLEELVSEELAQECKAFGPLKTRDIDGQEDIIMAREEEWVLARESLLGGQDADERNRKALRESMAEKRKCLKEFHERREREWHLRMKLQQLLDDHTQQTLPQEEFNLLRASLGSGWWLTLYGADQAAVPVDVLLRFFEYIMKRHPQHHLLIMMQSGATSRALCQDWLDQWQVSCFHMGGLDEMRLPGLGARHLQHVPALEQAAVLAEFVDPIYRPLVRTPALAALVLQSLQIARGASRLGTAEGGRLSRSEIYEVAVQATLLHVDARWRRRAAEPCSEEEERQGLVEARLALERGCYAQQRAGRRELRRADVLVGSLGRARLFLQELWERAQCGRAPLLEALADDAVCLFHPSMHEFLAAQHIWRRLLAGEGLPSWLAREEGPGAAAAAGAGCFLGAAVLARSQRARVERAGPPQPPPLAGTPEFVRTLAAMLRNVARVGDAEAIRGLREISTDWQALLHDGSGPSGRLPVHLAAERGHDAALAELAELGAPLAAGDAAGRTPAHLAARFGQVATLHVLKDLGAPLDAKANGGWTPLHTAAARGRTEALQALIALGAALDVQSARGWNAADVTSDGEALRLLKEHGVHAVRSF